MTTRADEVALYLKRRARWSPLEIAFWIFAFATIWLFPGKYLILKDTAILALFALSLDLILGYAGIISLGQAAFFGLAGYFSGLVAKYGFIDEPVIALICAGLDREIDVLRGEDAAEALFQSDGLQDRHGSMSLGSGAAERRQMRHQARTEPVEDRAYSANPAGHALAADQNDDDKHESDPELPVLRRQVGDPILQEFIDHRADQAAIEIAGAADNEHQEQVRGALE